MNMLTAQKKIPCTSSTCRTKWYSDVSKIKQNIDEYIIIITNTLLFLFYSNILIILQKLKSQK